MPRRKIETDFWLRRFPDLTREEYIVLDYGIDNIPDPWTLFHESELPPALQDWSLFEVVGDEVRLKQGRR